MIWIGYISVFIVSMMTSIINVVYLFYVYSSLDNEQVSMTSTVAIFYSAVAYALCRSIRNTLNVFEWKSKRPLEWKIMTSIWIVSIGCEITVIAWHGVSLHISPNQFLLHYTLWLICFISTLGIDIMFFRPDHEKRIWSLAISNHFRIYTAEEEECFICGEQTTEFIDLECNHQVHAECFARWCETGHLTCPLCRERVV